MLRGLLLLVLLYSFLSASKQNVINSALEKEIYNQNRWKALLHYSNKADINDNKFILSEGNFSLKNELIKTIDGFYKSPLEYKNINNHPQCKFPARLLFITHELNISKDVFPQLNCPDFKTYLDKAPADDISLVYVSEKVNNPSSMMGHTFLKFSGRNYKNRHVEHAITFYTVIETTNPLTLIYQNIIPGMKGMFALQPYKKTVEQYTKKENRNVWENRLKLTDYQKKLIYYHIWELKGIKMKYFFTSYNCSTVIYYNLSLANPKIYDDKKLWVTPLDTVKYLYAYHLLDSSNLLASDKWMIKMFEEQLKAEEIQDVKNIIENNNISIIASLNFYELQLLKAYAGLLYTKENITNTQYSDILNKIDNRLKQNNKVINISKYKNPSKTPDERQVGIGYSRLNKDDYVNVTFLGASHLLNDDNREYFSESELKIGYLSLLIDESSIDLKEFTLYGMKSYLPYDRLIEDLSYQFELSVQKEYTKKMNYKNTFKLDGGIGSDYQLTKDMSIYVMLNAGLSYTNEDKFKVFTNPEIGTIIYDVFNMKSIISYQPFFINTDIIYNKYSLKHNIFLNKSWTVTFDVDAIRGIKNYNNYNFLIKKLF